jgi:thiamine biosynthesis lipoprotein
MATVTLARNAMATRFEIVLHGADANSLRAAGEAALDEVERLEAQLSLFRPGSEIAQVNARAAREAVQVSPEVFALLQHAVRLARETGGAFDPTVAPLLECRGFRDGRGRVPTTEELAAARQQVGWEGLRLEAASRTVRFGRDGMKLDLGAIGKGFAVERAAEHLREAGVASALVHGGTSTLGAVGAPPEAEAWKIAVDVAGELERGGFARVTGTDAPPRFTVSLRDESLSVCAPGGRQLTAGGSRFGHIFDPRTGEPAEAALLAAVVAPSATESDALSTALLVLGRGEVARLRRSRTGVKTLLVWLEDGRLVSDANGFESHPRAGDGGSDRQNVR